MNCQVVQENLTFYLYDELGAEERAAVEAHLGACTMCARAAAELRRLRALLDQRALPEPSPELLVRCRQALEEALDREAASWRALVRSWFVVPPGVSALRVTTALTILLLGFSLGWTLRPRAGSPAAPAGRAESAPWVGADLANLRISGISQVAPDPQTGAVRITMDAERQVTLEGSLDDPRIREVMLYAAKRYNNPGIRRDTLQVLREQGDNPTVREALLYALRYDANAGVRLEAVEAVQGIAWDPDVREALLGALRTDDNPGVRAAVVNVLIEHADDEMLPVLEELATTDRSSYVRMKCARAARERAQD